MNISWKLTLACNFRLFFFDKWRPSFLILPAPSVRRTIIFMRLDNCWDAQTIIKTDALNAEIRASYDDI